MNKDIWKNLFEFVLIETEKSTKVVSVLNEALKMEVISGNSFSVQSISDVQDQLLSHTNIDDPYLAYIKDYTWGSNSTKMSQGLIFTDIKTYNIHYVK